MAETPTLIILVGGASSRMWPLKEKSLLRFGQDSLILYQLNRYASLGFKEAVLVGNPENLSDLQALNISGMNLKVTVQEQAIGMGDAILQAAPFVQENQAIYINQIHDLTELSLHENMLKMYR